MKTLPHDKNFLAEDLGSFEDAKITILPAPYEYRVSWFGGAGKGPQAVLDASAYVEFYDDEFDRELCFDKGIAAIEPLDFSGKVDKDALDHIKQNAAELLNKDKFVVTLGGEHTISTAPIEAHFRKYPDMSILHFDAHSDLRDSYEGSIYSHASFMARTTEFFPPERVVQAGIRALCKDERNFIRNKGVKTFFANEIRRGVHGDNWQAKIAENLSDEVYVTLDADYFDPSIIPATGTPEPDGFFYSETLDVFRELLKHGKKIVGFDVVELAPFASLHHPQLTMARLIYKMLNFAFAQQ